MVAPAGWLMMLSEELDSLTVIVARPEVAVPPSPVNTHSTRQPSRV